MLEFKKSRLAILLCVITSFCIVFSSSAYASSGLEPTPRISQTRCAYLDYGVWKQLTYDNPLLDQTVTVTGDTEGSLGVDTVKYKVTFANGDPDIESDEMDFGDSWSFDCAWNGSQWILYVMGTDFTHTGQRGCFFIND